jgi:hypothetical protein
VEVKSASCSVAANDNCVCNAVLTTAGSQTMTSGSYTTSGNQVIVVASASDGGVRDAGTDAAWEYCVSGNTLTLHSVTNSADGVMTLTR